MENISYIVASIKKWHIDEFEKIKAKVPGNWFLLNESSDLTIDYLNKINPQYIFFPHWSEKVSEEIINNYECICFHETDLPFGRGGSPIQNLINKGFDKTKISALKMTNEIDAGPIYLKKTLSLHGLAEEIYIRSAKTVFEMIETIIEKNLSPIQQMGSPSYFKRRKPDQSVIPKEISNLKELFDFIRMLDAEGYPSAKIIYNNFSIEFTRPAHRTDRIESNVVIKHLKNIKNE